MTVSGVTFGKPELNPESQTPMVDALWREMFPNGGEHCVLFAHSGNSGDIINGNVCTIADLPERLSCERLIVAGYHYNDDGTLDAADMLQRSFYNGCRHQGTDFGGNVRVGLASIIEAQQADHTRVETREHKDEEDRKSCEEWLVRHKKSLVGDDWLVVTVDYHN